jgi:hypothetical protein
MSMTKISYEAKMSSKNLNSFFGESSKEEEEEDKKE